MLDVRVLSILESRMKIHFDGRDIRRSKGHAAPFKKP